MSSGSRRLLLLTAVQLPARTEAVSEESSDCQTPTTRGGMLMMVDGDHCQVGAQTAAASRTGFREVRRTSASLNLV